MLYALDNMVSLKLSLQSIKLLHKDIYLFIRKCYWM